jgi:hypothetical protein
MLFSPKFSRGIRFNGHTTLGFSENSSDPGGMASVTDGTHTARVALLGKCIASSLAIAADGHDGTLATEAPPAVNLQPLVTPSHA